MVYVEVKGEKEIPADLTSRLEQLSDSIADLKAVEKELKNKIAIKRGELEMIVQQYGVEIIETDSTVVNINTSERFSKWKDVSEVFDMIPRRKQTIETMTPDIKKIRSMVEQGKLPGKILEKAQTTEITRISFKPVEEE